MLKWSCSLESLLPYQTRRAALPGQGLSVPCGGRTGGEISVAVASVGLVRMNVRPVARRSIMPESVPPGARLPGFSFGLLRVLPGWPWVVTSPLQAQPPLP